MKVKLLLIFLFGILNAFALTDKHEEESKESSDQTLKFLKGSTKTKDYGLGPRLANRIVGGKEAGKNEFPWMALIIGQTFCGGTLFTLRNVLSAAHCFTFRTKNLTRNRIILATFNVILGEHDTNTTDPEEQIFGIENFLTLKPDTNRPGVPHVNDLAVLKLNGTATINCYVSPICLAKYPVYHGDTVTIIGWGHTEYRTYDDELIVSDTSTSNVLKVGKTKVIRREDCSNYYTVPKDKNGHTIVLGAPSGEDIICTYDENYTGGVNNGDSGGPLMYYDPIAEQYEQVGIASSILGRSGEQTFVNVPYFLDKIREMVTDMEKK